MSTSFDASEHRNIIVPPEIFYDGSKYFRVIVDSAFGKAEVRLEFGGKIEASDSEESEEDSGGDEVEILSGTQDSDKTVANSVSPEKGKKLLEEEDGILSVSPRKEQFWPDFIDESTFLTRCSQNYVCREMFCNEMNRNLVLRLMRWKQLFLSLVDDVKRKYVFGTESCKEQVMMLDSFGDICNSIAGSGLPLHIMGARQILRKLDYPETIQEAELVEDVAEFENFEHTAHPSQCQTTFFVVTTYFERGLTKHVIYGVFPRYQERKRCRQKVERTHQSSKDLDVRRV